MKQKSLLFYSRSLCFLVNVENFIVSFLLNVAELQFFFVPVVSESPTSGLSTHEEDLDANEDRVSSSENEGSSESEDEEVAIYRDHVYIPPSN